VVSVNSVALTSTKLELEGFAEEQLTLSRMFTTKIQISISEIQRFTTTVQISTSNFCDFDH